MISLLNWTWAVVVYNITMNQKSKITPTAPLCPAIDSTNDGVNTANTAVTSSSSALLMESMQNRLQEISRLKKQFEDETDKRAALYKKIPPRG